jgi:hypothetical protein
MVIWMAILDGKGKQLQAFRSRADHSKLIERTLHALAAAIQNMGEDHRPNQCESMESIDFPNGKDACGFHFRHNTFQFTL